MAPSTPATSFNSDDSKHRGRSTERRGQQTLYAPPSPQQSDAGCGADEVVQQAYQAIWDSFCGRPAQTNLQFPLSNQQSYEELHRRLEEHPGLLAHFEEAVRRDWVAGVLTLRLKVPTPLHDQFQEEVKLAIWRELYRVATETPALRPFRNKIRPVGQVQVQKRQKSGSAHAPTFEASPGGQYRYDGVRAPPFILEVAYSQDADDLWQKITEVFVEMQGRVGTVLAFDIRYENKAQRKAQGHAHGASVSLWTSEQTDDTVDVIQVMDTQVFRGEDGRAVPGELLLPFRSFLPASEQAKLPQHARDEKLRLNFALLAQLLQAAEQTQSMHDASVSPSPPAGPQRPAKKIRFLDLNGDVTREMKLPASKRRRSSSGAPMSVRTRSSSQPRRSSRLRSVSQPRAPP